MDAVDLRPGVSELVLMPKLHPYRITRACQLPDTDMSQRDFFRHFAQYQPDLRYRSNGECSTALLYKYMPLEALGWI